jgi:myo-inositol-1(or 4)-monophosphatase
VTIDRYSFAKDLARKAGALLGQGYEQKGDVHNKSEIDLVTEYDLQSERLLVDEIQQAFPEDAIIAEEGGEYKQGAGYWVLDPLDGTVNFAHGVPIFCVSLAFLENGQPLLGVIFDPMQDQMFHAHQGRGAWLGERRLQVSETTTLNQSLLVTGFPYDIRTRSDNNLDHFANLALCTHGVRRLGSAALDLAYVAAGRFDGYWEMMSYPWDVSAGVLMVAEAGGLVCRADGGQIDFMQATSIVATNHNIHSELLDALAEGKLPANMQ